MKMSISDAAKLRMLENLEAYEAVEDGDEKYCFFKFDRIEIDFANEQNAIQLFYKDTVILTSDGAVFKDDTVTISGIDGRIPIALE